MRPSVLARRLVVAVALAPLALAGCSPADSSSGHPSGHVAGEHASASPAAASTVLDRLGLGTADAVTAIDALDRSTEQRPLDVKASVKNDRLELQDAQGERSLPIPADRFYLSIAPYVTRTHECFAHSLSGCQGEQVDKPVHVTITDTAGKKLVDADATTWTNGFVGFWVPRGTSGTVTATIDGKTGSTPFATTSESPTCLTTLQLH